MAADKVKPRYIFENPNPPKAVEQILIQIVIEKLISCGTSSLHKVN